MHHLVLRLLTIYIKSVNRGKVLNGIVGFNYITVSI